MKVSQNGCAPGYEMYTAPVHNFLYPLPDTTSRCPAGQYYSSGTCVSYAQSGCETGYVHAPQTWFATTFDTKIANDCAPGYKTLAVNHNVAYVVSSFNAKCGVGYHPTKSGCVANTNDNCPSGYYGCAPTNSFAIYNSNGECDTNYSSYGDVALCPLYGVGDDTAGFCTPLCDYGYNHTHADTCARSCPYPNMSAMHSSLGHNWPLYLDKTTFPALNVQTNDGTCYINLLPGNINGTLNFKYQDREYHVVE